jgi:K+-sensing histidine kinase KdpD
MNDKSTSHSTRAQEPQQRPSARPLAAGLQTVHQLRNTLEKFQEESVSLLRGASNLEEFIEQQESRYAELEQELNDTALLYVASYQLNSRREPKEVLRQVRELLEQLAGVEVFAVYIGSGEEDSLLLPVSSRGIPLSELRPLRSHERPLDAACAGRCAVLSPQDPLGAGTLAAPLAVIPLLLGDRVLGAISVMKLFPHKSSWAQVDQQLFQLLASHGASALVAAYLYQRHSDVPGALAELGDSLK